MFNGEGLLEPRPPGDCVCVLESLRKRSPKREFLGVEGEFLILFFGEKGPGVDHMQALGSDPHAKPPKGPRERGALDSRGAWARLPPVSLVLQGELCVLSSSPQRAGGDARVGKGPEFHLLWFCSPSGAQ